MSRRGLLTTMASVIGVLSALPYWQVALAARGFSSLPIDPARYFGWRVIGTLNPLVVLAKDFGVSQAFLAPALAIGTALVYLGILAMLSRTAIGSPRYGLATGLAAGLLLFVVSIFYGWAVDFTGSYDIGFLAGGLALGVYPLAAYTISSRFEHLADTGVQGSTSASFQAASTLSVAHEVTQPRLPAVSDLAALTARKAKAIGVLGLGTLIWGGTCAGGIMAGTNTDEEATFWSIAVPGALVGFVMVWWGWWEWRRITHVLWTKQALREFADEHHYIIESPAVPPVQVNIASAPPQPVPQSTPAQRQQLLEALENLKLRLAEGKISEATYQELKRDFEAKLNELDKQV